jgi:hypothetical protein
VEIRMQIAKAEAHEGSDGDWTTGHLCHILANNLCTYYPCPGTMNEAELKSNGI